MFYEHLPQKRVPDLTHFKRFCSIAYPHLSQQRLRETGRHSWIAERAELGVYAGVTHQEGGHAQNELIPSRIYFQFFTTSWTNVEKRMYYREQAAERATRDDGHNEDAAAEGEGESFQPIESEDDRGSSSDEESDSSDDDDGLEAE